MDISNLQKKLKKLKYIDDTGITMVDMKFRNEFIMNELWWEMTIYNSDFCLSLRLKLQVILIISGRQSSRWNNLKSPKSKIFYRNDGIVHPFQIQEKSTERNLVHQCFSFDNIYIIPCDSESKIWSQTALTYRYERSQKWPTLFFFFFSPSVLTPKDPLTPNHNTHFNWDSPPYDTLCA